MRGTDWNAAAYDGLSDPQYEWGMALLETVALGGGERVMDAGCGSGRLAEELLRRLSPQQANPGLPPQQAERGLVGDPGLAGGPEPSGRLVALDSSPQMLQECRRRLADFGSRVEFVQASLQDFALSTPVDGIFSNAVFHWVSDHAAMFRCLRRALVADGWLVAQFGGLGNLERTHRRADEVAGLPAFRETLRGVEYGAHFEDVVSTRERMEAAGFKVTQAGLHRVEARFEQRERYEAFLRTVVLRQPLAKLTEALRGHFLEEVSRRTLAEEGGYILDYVRLTVRAQS